MGYALAVGTKCHYINYLVLDTHKCSVDVGEGHRVDVS